MFIFKVYKCANNKVLINSKTSQRTMFKFDVCCCDKHHGLEPLGERMVYFILHFQAIVYHWGDSAQALMQERLGWKWFTVSFSSSLSATFKRARAHLCRDGTTHSGQGPEISICIQENASQLQLQATVVEVVIEVQTLFSVVSGWQPRLVITDLQFYCCEKTLWPR